MKTRNEVTLNRIENWLKEHGKGPSHIFTMSHLVDGKKRDMLSFTYDKFRTECLFVAAIFQGSVADFVMTKKTSKSLIARTTKGEEFKFQS